MGAESGEVDRDINLQVAYQLGYLSVALRPHIDETIERSAQSRAHLVRGIGAERNSGGLKARPIMGFEHSGEQKRHRVQAKIPR
jgi:hypothetical protein